MNHLFSGLFMRLSGFVHLFRVVYYQLVKPRLWELVCSFRSPVPKRTQFASLFGQHTTSGFLQNFFHQAQSRLLFSGRNNTFTLKDTLTSLVPTETLLVQAQEASEHRFTFFTDSPLALGTNIDWQRDYKRGKHWPLLPYQRLNLFEGDGKDSKYPTEVSKCHWFSWLGEAYWLTGDSAWAQTFQRDAQDWMFNNPVNYGINWAIPLEVAVRAANWINAFSFFHLSDDIPDEFWLDYGRMLYAHGSYLEYNLEYVRVPGNHFACNCLGLLALGNFFYDSHAGRRWFRMGKKFLEREIQRQVYEDGVNFEKSVPYHRWITEIFTYATLIARQNGSPFSEAYHKRLGAMYDYMAAYVRPDGTAPMIGDADNARIFRFLAYEDFNSQADNLALGASLFKRADWTSKIDHPSHTALFMLGEESAQLWTTLKASGTKPEAFSHFQHGGYVIHQSPFHHLFIDVGDYGKEGRGGHGHNDCLSCELWINGRVFLTDSGTGTYSGNPALRNTLRSTRAHNTVMIDGAEQVDFAGLWKIQADETHPTIRSLTADNNTLLLDAEHYGYQARFNAIHRRIFQLSVQEHHGKLIITDHVETSRPLSSFYHIAPGWEVRKTENAILAETEDQSIRMEIDAPFEIRQAPYSPAYGIVGETWEIEIQGATTVRIMW